jgi:hypothetical protein
VNKVSEKKLVSLKNIEKILKDIISNPINYLEMKDLQTALSSQGGLARFECNLELNGEKLIVLMSSINTQKRLSASIFKNGYAHIDQLRLNALESINPTSNKETSENRRTKDGLYKTVKGQDKRIEYYQEQHLVWIQIVDRAKKAIKDIGSTDDISLREYKVSEAILKINAALSLVKVFEHNELPSRSNNVFCIDDFKDL